MTEFEPLDEPRHIEAVRRDYRPNSAVALGETIAALINGQAAETLRATIARLEAEEAMCDVVEMLTTAADALKTRQALVEAAMARLLFVHET